MKFVVSGSIFILPPNTREKNHLDNTGIEPGSPAPQASTLSITPLPLGHEKGLDSGSEFFVKRVPFSALLAEQVLWVTTVLFSAQTPEWWLKINLCWKVRWEKEREREREREREWERRATKMQQNTFVGSWENLSGTKLSRNQSSSFTLSPACRARPP